MDLGLKGKSAFIAASSKGLGKSVALELAREGANVVICSRNETVLRTTEELVSEAGEGRVLAIQGDITSSEDRLPRPQWARLRILD